MYRHIDKSGSFIELPVGKVVCVGRNYIEHIRELNNEVPTEALLFHKPSPTLCHAHEPIVIPKGLGDVHNELELAILINEPLKNASPSQVVSAIWGVGLGLDLTLRDVQSRLKAKGLPWEKAKSFDYACPVSHFISIEEVEDLTDIAFELYVNQSIRQQGNASHMIRSVSALISEISQCFSLLPGDIVMTGTPKGVGPLNSSDKLTLKMSSQIHIDTVVT